MGINAHSPSRKRQCELLGVPRSSSYYKPQDPSAEQVRQEGALDEALHSLYNQDATLGRRRLSPMLSQQHGIKAGRKRIRTARKRLGLRTIYRHPRTSIPGRRKDSPRHPYLLRGKGIKRVDEVWTSDITYLQIGQKNLYLCVVMDWASRSVLGWSLRERMTTALCMEALEMALASGRKPQIFNTDQGTQYTPDEFQKRLEEEGIRISLDGKGRWADNVIMERFWRTYKHEFFLLREFASLEALVSATAAWLDYYNHERVHSSLDYRSPAACTAAAGVPPPAQFLSALFASGRLASLRSAPSLRSGRRPCALKALKNWFDTRRIA